MAAFVAVMPMTPEDVGAVAALEGQNSGSWSRGQLASQLAQPDGWQFVARRQTDKEIIGYICGHELPPEAELYRIAVHEQSRRQGIGKMLLAYALEQLHRQGVERCFLECRNSNQAALLLYGGMGFVEVGCRKNYYRDPQENAILMALFFNSGAIA